MTRFSLRRFFLAVGLSAVSTISAAQDASTTSVWEVSKDSDTVYVGGTIHILPISEFPLPAAFTDTYEKSDTIVLEAELPDPTDIAAQQRMIEAMAYTGESNLKDKLSEETFNALNQYLGMFGANAEQLARFKPGLVATMLITMEAQRVNMAGEGVDAYFTQLAKRDNKPREYLETIDFQLNMLANMGVGEEERFISETLTTLPEFKEIMQGTIDAWREGDSETIETLVIDTFKRESPSSFDDVFTKRNQNWVPQIEAMFGDDDSEFVLVGAGHLVGEGNVLELLKAKGYTVKQL
ncbi:TraB/GumN family protein [Alteromonas sp. S167]|uniref:TraB/GumN family protein n=1 Tax=Alteromonas sp. S167 TaxID=3117402 RepID=UPI002FE2C749